MSAPRDAAIIAGVGRASGVAGGESRLAGLLVFSALLIGYVLTLAPSVTLWDAGEFMAAVQSLGIPHPPGTPLFVLLGTAWAKALFVLPPARALNLLSAVCTALACALIGGLLARWLRSALAGFAAGLTAGAMSSVWMSATETEVYAVALLLSTLMLASAHRASDEEGSRWTILTAFLFLLAPPLHLSALVSGPAAILLAVSGVGDATTRRASARVARVALLLGAFTIAVGMGTVSPWILLGGAILLAASVALRAPVPRRVRLGHAVAVAALAAVGASVFLFMLVRAKHDPAINQGDPSTFSAMIDVIARRQYAVPGLLPRRAPLWLQLGNLIQYADWQVALGLDRWVGASVKRTPLSALFALLGVAGSLAHRRADRRSWRAMLVLFLSATVGVVLYLNLRAGPSFGHGILPPEFDREPRERDYFFALGFAIWGAWAGLGAMTAMSRGLAASGRYVRRVSALAGLAVAALPLALNWRATDRSREPEAWLARTFALELLRAVPRDGVLFTAGDNDTYPVWYLQQVEGARLDVVPITTPLLGATWYRQELAKRWRLLDTTLVDRWLGEGPEMREIARRALELGRPVAMSTSFTAAERKAVSEGWVMAGLVYLRHDLPDAVPESAPEIDHSAVAAAAGRLSGGASGVTRSELMGDGASRYVASLLSCPKLAVRAVAGAGGDTATLLASRCNLR